MRKLSFDQLTVAAAALFVLGVPACGGASDGTAKGDEQPGANTTTVTGASTSDIYIDGKRYVSRGPAHISDEEDVVHVEKPGAEPAVRSYTTMSDKALAEALRPVVLRNGTEYILAEPDLEMARKVKEQFKNGESGKVEPSATGGEESETRVQASGPVGRIDGVIDSDERTRPNHLAYPHTTVTQMTKPGTGCSATLVGPHTFLTAAHCVVVNSNAWRPFPTMVPGRDNLDTANQIPFGTYVNDYSVSVPNGYWNSDDDWFYDFAIIVTGGIYTDPRPGDLTGWKGIAWNNNSDAVMNRWLYLYGYPGEKPFGTPWGEGRCCDQSTSILYSQERIFTNIDATAGQSGSGFYTYINGSPYVEIIYKGTWTTGLSTWNTGRLIDSGVFNFYATCTPDF